MSEPWQAQVRRLAQEAVAVIDDEVLKLGPAERAGIAQVINAALDCQAQQARRPRRRRRHRRRAAH